MTSQETVKEIEEDARELRLTEQLFFKNVICGIKRRYEKTILWLVSGFAGSALVWGLLACPFLRFVHMCPMH